MEERMPKTALAEIWKEVAERRGCDWAFPNLHGPQTALIGCEVSRLGLSLAPKMRSVIPRIDWLARAIRAAGGSVIWTHFSEDAFDGPEGDILGEKESQKMRTRLGDASWTEVNEGIQDSAEDRRLARVGYSAFTPRGSHLPHILKDMQVDTIVLVGAETDGCIESNARDACSAGFRVIVASDGCSAQDEAAHVAAMTTLHRRFADLRPTEEIVRELRRNLGG